MRLTIKETAKRLNCNEQFLRVALQQGKFSEFGAAVKTSSHYTYYINERRLDEWLKKGGKNERL
ncbi:MAG: hypothetical protein HXO49_03655 [Prevotella sp.]|nr:hypothetical protein [Prevotella sp.]